MNSVGVDEWMKGPFPPTHTKSNKNASQLQSPKIKCWKKEQMNIHDHYFPIKVKPEK